MKRAGLAGEVRGFARSAQTRETARRIGLATARGRYMGSRRRRFVAVPVRAMGEVAREIAPF